MRKLLKAWPWLTVVALGCGSRAPDPGSVPTLEDTKSESSDGGDGESLFELSESDVALPTLGPFEPGPVASGSRWAPPASAPNGEPVVIQYRAPRVGDLRMRAQVTDELYGVTKEGHSQRTTLQYLGREEVKSVENHVVSELRVDVRTYKEEVVMTGQGPTWQPSLTGTFLVGPGPRGVAIRRPDGSRTYSVEQEQLSSLLSGEFRPPTIVELLINKKLRLGETVELSDDDKKAIGGAGLNVPIYLTLTEVTSDLATFQIRFVIEGTGMFKFIGSEQTIVIDRKTGQIREVEHRRKREETDRSDQYHMKTVIIPIRD